MEKTNVMRILDAARVPYEPHAYGDGTALSGVEVAALLGIPPERVFKTLVTTGKSGKHYVFVVPVACGLHLKRAAQAVGEKSVEMLKQKELLPLTGYVHGGCSPIGMKKPLPTILDASAEGQERILFSAGKIGYQVELAPEALRALVDCRLADIAQPEEP